MLTLPTCYIFALTHLASATIPPIRDQGPDLVLFQETFNATKGDPVLNPATVANTSLANTDLTVEPWCSDVLGENLSPVSCRDAITKIPQSTQSLSFGWRGRGRYDVTLPYIWMSSAGTCAVFVAANGRFDPDRYSFSAIAADANLLQQTCVGDTLPNTGGALNGVGQGGKLSVQLVEQVPYVLCDAGPSPSYTSCRSVLNTMPYDDTPRRFGPRGTAGAQIQLPFLIPSSERSVPAYDFSKLFGANLPPPVDGQCVFQITSDGRVDTAPWSSFFKSIAQVTEIRNSQHLTSPHLTITYQPDPISIATSILISPQTKVVIPVALLMEEATGYVNSLKMPHLKQILRSRGQYDRGRKPALQNRLVEGLRKDYAEGWTHGRMLNTKIVPFNGRGRDPKELIGLHLKSFQLIGRRYGVLGGTLRFTDGEDQVIMMRPSRRVATAICIDFEDSYWNSWGYCVGREDEYQWEREERVWEKEEVWRKPAPIIEAVRGIRRNSQDESTSVVLGLRCEGMSKMGFFCCEATRPTLLYTYPSYGDIWLADDEERGLADIRLLHGP